MAESNTYITGGVNYFKNNTNSFNNCEINRSNTSILRSSIGNNTQDINIYSDCTINGYTSISGNVTILESNEKQIINVAFINSVINTNKYAISNDYIYFTDTINNMFNRLDISTEEITGLATITGAMGIDVYPSSNPIVALVTSTTDGWVRKVDLGSNSVIEMIQLKQLAFLTPTSGTGTASILAGKHDNGTSAYFNGPKGIAIHPTENYAVVTDTNNHRIRKIDLATKVVTTPAGVGSSAIFYPERIKIALTRVGTPETIASARSTRLPSGHDAG